MRRTLAFALVGLLLGAALHIAVVLAMPMFAAADAWHAVAALGPDDAFHLLPPPAGTGALRSDDPFIAEAVCRFRLDGGPVRVRAVFPDEFWSAAVLDPEGRNIYSLNDGSGQQTTLDLTIAGVASDAAPPPPQASPAQQPDQTAAILATLPIDGGLVVLRAFVPDEAARPQATAALSAAECDASP